MDIGGSISELADWGGGSPFFIKGNQRVYFNYGESNSSASLVRSMQGCWRKESDRLSNPGSRMNNVGSVPAVEQVADLIWYLFYSVNIQN